MSTRPSRTSTSSCRRARAAPRRQNAELASARAANQPVDRRQEPIVDTRLTGKPKQFSGKEEDWAQWAVTRHARNAGAVSARLLWLSQENPVNETLQSDDDRQLSTHDVAGREGRGQGPTRWARPGAGLKSLTDF